jgi:membrane protein YqaA with SNARE-associated domain
MIEYLASMALASAIGLIIGYALGSKSDVPVKRTIEQMNEAEAERSQARKTKAYIDGLWDVKP